MVLGTRLGAELAPAGDQLFRFEGLVHFGVRLEPALCSHHLWEGGSSPAAAQIERRPRAPSVG